MLIHFYRNATMKLEYGGKVFLVDPMFRGKGVVHKLGPTLYPEKPPLIDLPEDGKNIADGIDAVLLTHLHPGHFDQEAADLIPKDLPFFVQNLNDKDLSRKYGMNKTQTIDMTLDTHLDDIRIIRTAGLHGNGKIMHVINTMQNSSGIVLKKEKDFVREAGKMVDVSLYEPLDGSKQITGKLIGCEDNALKLEELEPIDMKKIAQVRLHIDI